MPEKLPSEIIKIELDDATFRGTHVVIEPTYVNFFFGNNGTGKFLFRLISASSRLPV